jgi:hypothetical protein
MVEHHDCAVLGGQSVEGLFKGVASRDGCRGIREAGALERQLADVRVAPSLAGLVERGPHHESIGPGVESVEVT